MVNFSNRAAPFDAVAADYDRQFSETRTGRLQREVVWRFVFPFLPENGGRVFELNGGTGEDALWMARQGCLVLTSDASEKMIEIADGKAFRAGFERRIETRKIDLETRKNWPSISNDFPLIFSNFGGMNCLSPEKMAELDRPMAEILTENGRFVAVVMGRFCFWETLYFLMKGRWKTAFRRRRRSPVAARLDDSTSIPTFYFSPGEFARFFPSFDVEMVRPVGVFLPPSYLDPFFLKRKSWLARLDFLEKKFGNHSFLAGLADHFLIVLKRRPTDESVG